MKRRIPHFAASAAAVLAALLLAPRLAAEKKPFERYQSIIDRQPFGALPPDFDPMRNPDEVQKGSAKDDAALSVEQEVLQKSVNFSVINVEPDGTVMVGFSDKSDAKSPRHYYIAVGETRDGWFVKEADPVKATMTVEKDGVEISLEIGANSAPSGGGGKSAKGGRGSPAQSGPRASLLKRGGDGSAPSSFKGRRAAREQREAEERAERERAQAEAEARAAEEKAQREAEKAEREAERAEQREQLMNIREELRRAREEKDRIRAEEAAAEAAGEAQTEGGSDE